MREVLWAGTENGAYVLHTFAAIAKNVGDYASGPGAGCRVSGAGSPNDARILSITDFCTGRNV